MRFAERWIFPLLLFSEVMFALYRLQLACVTGFILTSGCSKYPLDNPNWQASALLFILGIWWLQSENLWPCWNLSRKRWAHLNPSLCYFFFFFERGSLAKMVMWSSEFIISLQKFLSLVPGPTRKGLGGGGALGLGTRDPKWIKKKKISREWGRGWGWGWGRRKRGTG